ncbi:MAG TPA: response regulator [Polyangia bacterium]|nr:response regulator [Polyangia bacterium]
MLKLVTSNNTAVFRELKSPSFLALELRHTVVTTGTEALKAVHAEHPDLVILDVDLPELSGYDVCAAIKAEQALHETRVILVVTGGPSPAEVDHLAASGCDDIMTIPVPADDLYSHAARLLNLPARNRSQVRAQVLLPEGARTPVVRGEATSIALEAIEIAVEQPVDVGTEVRLRLARAGAPQAVVVRGRVIASDENPHQRTRTLRVKLTGLRPEDERALADLALWEVVERREGLQVMLRGDITERTSFALLRAQLGQHAITFDLGGIRYLNSTGLRRWVEFLESLDPQTSYQFIRCSTAFVTQFGLVARALGRGKVISFLAPYRCDTCERETEQLLQTASLAIPVGKTYPSAPTFACTQCGGPLQLDEVPERFFAFMQQAR